MKTRALLILLCAASDVRADERYAHGFYAEMALGATGFLGPTGAYAAVGPTYGLRAGYEPTRWLALGACALGSTHEATVPPPPEREFFQLYTFAGEARLAVRAGRVALFAEGSVGATLVSTNVLDRVGVTAAGGHVTTAFGAGGGLDYHIENRHFSVGLAGGWVLYPDFDASQSVTLRLYLRYAK